MKELGFAVAAEAREYTAEGLLSALVELAQADRRDGLKVNL